MIRIPAAIYAVAICTLLAGCGVQGEAYQQRPTPATESLIYIYRPYKLLSSQAEPMITCGHESIELAAGGFDEFEADPGQITCAISTEANAAYTFEAHPGERYFIKEVVDATGLTTHARLVRVDPDLGSDELKECSRQGIKQ
jgi:hypothetical protein